MAPQLKWNGKQFEEMLKKATSDGLMRAGVFYHTKCRVAVSKPNTGVSVKADDVVNQARDQLGENAKQGLVTITTQRKKADGTFETLSAKHWYNEQDFAERISEKTGRKLKAKSVTIYPNPSKPGESPKVRTGFGRNNIVINHDPKGRYVRIGVSENGMYMFWLEVGTRSIARRPWLLKTLMDNQRVIGALAATGGRATK